ncbi:HAD domain-containing protein [Cryobacterium lactosi]|nr:HAD domain-containing protein [Cryobacterium lactosi]
MQPIPLFLDIDGVLVVYRFADSDSGRLSKVALKRQKPADSDFPSVVTFDAKVVAELNALVDDDLVELVWLSSWDHGANRLLAPAVGMKRAPYAVAEVGSRFADRVRANVWIKTLAASRWMKANRPAGTPFIMVDDLLTNQSRGQMSPQRRSLDDITEPGCLLVATDATRGLLLSRLAEIRQHARAFAAAQQRTRP